MDGDEDFFKELDALTKLYANVAEDVRKRGTILKKMPMLLHEESEPLNTILICRHPEERILITKNFDDLKKRKK